MSAPWLKNIAGVTVTDQDMEKIPNPLLELMVHITTKTIQAGSILGMGVVGPVTGVIRGPRTLAAIGMTAVRFGVWGAGIGAAAGPVMTIMAMRKQEQEAIYDRCYRLRFNRNQVTTDRMAYLGAMIGVGAAAYMGVGLIQGAVVGLAFGTFDTGIYNNFIKSKSK